jgi:hypothetical protein
MSSITPNSGKRKRTRRGPLSGHFLKVQERKAEKNEQSLNASLDRIQAYCDSRNVTAQHQDS